MVGHAALAAAYCALLCALAPRASSWLMRERREAHQSWFAAGAAGYAASSETGAAWAKTLPRLIEDRAIGREDAAMAAKMGVPNLPRFDSLPTAGEVSRRYEIRPPRLHRLTAELTVAGLALGALLSLIGASAPQIALLGAIASLCALLGIVDRSCRIIPDSVVGLLCLLGLCLRAGCGQRGEFAPLALTAAAICGCMYLADAVYARLHGGRRAIGNGDKKVMAAVVLCSGFSGIVVAYAALVALLAAATLIDKDRRSKRPFGPYAAAATLIGAIASATV